MKTHEETMQSMPYQHIGDAGTHQNHRLVADDMQDIWCQDCRIWLADAEAKIGWPIEDDES